MDGTTIGETSRRDGPGGQGVRGKYAQRYSEGSNVVVLSPDVAEAFPDSASVNRALRSLIAIARNEVRHDPTGG
jgi:hypothetical protein